MVIPINYESEDYRFFKTLNEDVQLKPVGNGKHYDIQFMNGDYVNVAGKESLYNAIVIAIMTRFNELSDIKLYDEFGCRVHELLKARFTEMVEYEMIVFLTETLENMRRIKEVHQVDLIKLDDIYKISFRIKSINDEMIAGSVEI